MWTNDEALRSMQIVGLFDCKGGLVKASLAAVLAIVLSGLVGSQSRASEGHLLDTSKESMKKIANSLGVKCTHCHLQKTPEGKVDYGAPSPLKATAIHMKLHFVDSLRTSQGKALDCQTCHQGRATFVPRDVEGAKPSEMSKRMSRRDIFKRMKQIEKALGVTCDYCHVRNKEGRLAPKVPTKHKLMAKYMMDNFSGRLKKLDGTSVDCSDCHRGKAKFLPRSESK